MKAKPPGARAGSTCPAVAPRSSNRAPSVASSAAAARASARRACASTTADRAPMTSRLAPPTTMAASMMGRRSGAAGEPAAGGMAGSWLPESATSGSGDCVESAGPSKCPRWYQNYRGDGASAPVVAAADFVTLVQDASDSVVLEGKRSRDQVRRRRKRAVRSARSSSWNGSRGRLSQVPTAAVAVMGSRKRCRSSSSRGPGVRGSCWSGRRGT